MLAQLLKNGNRVNAICLISHPPAKRLQQGTASCLTVNCFANQRRTGLIKTGFSFNVLELSRS